MQRRVTAEGTLGETDRNLRRILGDDTDETPSKIRRVLLDVIKNELTARQSEIIMLYYFKEMNTVEIAALLNITPSTVSTTLIRARNKLFRILRYAL